MPRRKLVARVTALVLAALAVALVAGCGSGGGASSSTPADQLLRDTFSGKKNVTSGRLSIALNVDSQGGTTSVQGPISAQISGPFESQGKGKLPKFAIDAVLRGGGQDLTAGLTSMGDKGYVRFQGIDYAVSNQVFQQFKKGYEQAQAQAGSGQGRSLASLGVDPQRWLTNARNAGEAKVGDTDTIKITGGVNVGKLLDDVDTLLQRTRQLGGSAAQSVPQQLTEQEKQQAEKAVKHVSVQIYTGKDDKILRRMVIALGLLSSGQSANVKLDVQLTNVNDGQDISAPSNPKPFNQLLSQLNGLGLSSGSGSSSSGSGASGSGATGSGGGASAGNLQKYSQCIEKAGNDASKARKCANLLTP